MPLSPVYKLLSLLILAPSLGAITFAQIESKPPSRAKNFMIWQYLQEDITSEEAKKAYKLVDGYSRKIFNVYVKKSNDPKIIEQARCQKLKASDINLDENSSCLKSALSVRKSLKLNATLRSDLASQLGDGYEYLTFLNEPEFKKQLQNYKPDTFVKVFNGVSPSYRHKHFNHFIDQNTTQRLSEVKGFERSIKLIVTDKQLIQLQRSLLSIDSRDLSSQTNFFLALNQVRHLNYAKAMQLLQSVYNTSYYQMDKDKAQFWMYLISKNDMYLKALSEGFDINIYTLYAKEKLGKEVTNFFTRVYHNDDAKFYDIEDPFVWNTILQEIKGTPNHKLFDLARKYSHPSLDGVQAFILERAYRYKTHAYILPYYELMKDMPLERKILMLSLMKQESNDIPAALSRSFALGLMQLMPFLVKVLDKKESPPINELSDMFNPQRNIKYASKHIAWMEKSLSSPLFMAYAYNGGMGFFKRYLLKGNFSKGSFEPFISMELMANSESREYGKKVLANYVMYKKVFNQKVSILRLFDNVLSPTKSDRFREQE